LSAKRYRQADEEAVTGPRINARLNHAHHLGRKPGVCLLCRSRGHRSQHAREEQGDCFACDFNSLFDGFHFTFPCGPFPEQKEQKPRKFILFFLFCELPDPSLLIFALHRHLPRTFM
jgi:hypothetical protein